MNGAFQDLRCALRSLTKSPGFAAVAVATLALGIGANTAIFSVVEAVLLRPLGFRQPERLVTLEEREKDGSPSNTSFATYVDWRARNRSFEEIAAMSYWTPKLSGGGRRDAEKLEGIRVTDGFFQMLGVRPALGRDFLPEEQRTGNHHVVLLGHGLWVRRFGSDPAIVGSTVLMGDTPYLVAGVLPADFESVFSPSPGRPTEIWAPLGYNASQPWACRDCRHLRAIGRLRASVTLEGARAEMDAISQALSREYPNSYSAPGVFVTPFAERLSGGARSALWSLAAAVGLVLLIGCANVGTLLLGRAAARRREVAVRFALGASRGRIARLFLTEAAVLSIGGGALGLAAVGWALPVLTASAPELPRLAAARVDGSVLLFTLAVSTVTGLLFGGVPALRLSRLEPALREGAVGGLAVRSRRSGALLVAFDVALALALFFGAGLLLKSVSRLLRVDPGFRSDGLLTMEVDLYGNRYEKDPAVVEFFDRVRERVERLPGVVSAGLVSQLPLGGNFDTHGVHPEGHLSTNPEQDPSADRYSASPGYLATMGIPVRRGRGILETDRADSPPVVLVNETLAQSVWGSEDPLGKRVKVGGTDGPWRTVVGVARDVRHASLAAPRSNQIYLPLSQFVDNGMVLVVRARAEASSLAPAVRAAIRSVDADQPVMHVATIEQVIAASTATRRFSRDLLVAFAATALLLAAIGIGGVVSSFVSRHTREIGIRMALGARRYQILRLIAFRMLRLALGGLAAGALAGLVLGRWLRGQLFEVGGADPAVLLAGVLTILSAVGAATLLPARRAARIDPVDALRSE